jgi:adenylosuccinate synthase
MKGWSDDLHDTKSFSELPHNAQVFLKYIESFLEVPGIHTSIE